MSALRNPKRELFCRELALALADGMSGRQAETKAATAAGYSGSSLAKNAHKWAQQASIKRRLGELMERAVERSDHAIGVTVDWAIGKLKNIVDFDDAIPKTSDQIAAVALIAKLSNWKMAADKHEHAGPDGQPIVPLIVEIVRFGDANSPPAV